MHIAVDLGKLSKIRFASYFKLWTRKNKTDRKMGNLSFYEDFTWGWAGESTFKVAVIDKCLLLKENKKTPVVQNKHLIVLCTA